MPKPTEVAKKCMHSRVLRAKESEIFKDDVLLCANPKSSCAEIVGGYKLCVGVNYSQQESGMYRAYIDLRYFHVCPGMSR